eukprot:2745879-Ditylum_brightwellii.AAC.1
MPERRKQIDGLAREVMCNCLDKGEYTTNEVDYIEHNVKLAMDVMNSLRALEERLQQLLKINFNMMKKKILNQQVMTTKD